MADLKNVEMRPLVQMDGQTGMSGDLIILENQIEHRPSFSHVRFNLKGGENVVAGGGKLKWMDGKVKMDTWCWGGGCWHGYCRTCAGEPCCNNKFSGPGEVAFGYDLPGDMLPFGVTAENGWIVSAGSFVCSTENVRVTSRFAGCSVCLCFPCIGEGPFLTKIVSESGPGIAWMSGFGELKRHEIPTGKSMLINAGLFFAANDRTNIEITIPAGLCMFCCGGEQFVMRITGPGVVYTQNRDSRWLRALLFPKPHELAREIAKQAIELGLKVAEQAGKQ